MYQVIYVLQQIESNIKCNAIIKYIDGIRRKVLLNNQDHSKTSLGQVLMISGDTKISEYIERMGLKLKGKNNTFFKLHV